MNEETGIRGPVRPNVDPTRVDGADIGVPVQPDVDPAEAWEAGGTSAVAGVCQVVDVTQAWMGILNHGGVPPAPSPIGGSEQVCSVDAWMAHLNSVGVSRRLPGFSSVAAQITIVPGDEEWFDIQDEGPTPTTDISDELRCGPDITEWLVDKLNELRGDPVVQQIRRSVRDSKWGRGYYRFVHFLAASLKFREIALDPDSLDVKVKHAKEWSIPQKCPIGPECDFTVTICGECFRADTPGNILFAYIGHNVCGFTKGYLRWGAAKAARDSGGQEDLGDVQTYPVGWALDTPVTKEGLCEALQRLPPAGKGEIFGITYEMSPARRPLCAPCPKVWTPRE